MCVRAHECVCERVSPAGMFRTLSPAGPQRACNSVQVLRDPLFF